jgi:flagellar biosynthesis protein
MSDELDRARRRAIALRYDAARDSAPKVIARGRGYTAEKIVELARQHGLPVHHDPDLAALLAELEVNQEIPEDLYKAVAEVLAFVYRLSRESP